MQAVASLRSVLKQRLIAPASPESVEARVMKAFGAQIGEMGWHSVHVDPRLDDISANHASAMEALIEKHGLAPADRPVRILEVGAYAHHSVHAAAARVGGIGVAHDISPVSLRLGKRRAEELGLDNPHGVLAAGDFHDLPFSDGYFDLVFVASSIHHTWRPWTILTELIRVARPGAAIHLYNEPVGRACCMYKFRSNRKDILTPFEAEIDKLGLMWTVSSPFPEARSESLFGMIENDRIPLEIYKDTISSGADIVEWSPQSSPYIDTFEKWVLDLPLGTGTAEAIFDRLSADLSRAARALTPRDKLSGIGVPTPEDIWPMAYRVASMLATLPELEDKSEMLARMFGAALRCTAIKRDGPSSDAMLRRHLPGDRGVLLDQPTIQDIDVTFENKMPGFDKREEVQAFFPPDDWMIMEDDVKSFANTRSTCAIHSPAFDLAGIWILRVYSIALETPYVFSVLVGDKLVYSHGVAVSESHLARIVVEAGQSVQIVHHDEEGQPILETMTSRVIPTFVELRRSQPS